MANHGRPDGESPGSGSRAEEPTEQGVTSASAWKRGQARGRQEELAAARRLISDPEFQRLLSSISDVQRQLTTSLVMALSSYAKWWASIRPHIEQTFEAMAAALPPNWQDVDFGAACRLAEAGWPIVWVPRSSLVAQLLAATSDEDRDEILVLEARAVIDDVMEALNAVAPRGASAIADALREAAACAADDRWIASQATTAAALDTIVGAETLIKKHKSTLRDRYSTEDVGMYELRMALILRALPGAFDSYRANRGQEMPSRFNRHATVHHLSYLQLTKANALFGLLFATSLVRELAAHGSNEVIVHDLVIRPRL